MSDQWSSRDLPVLDAAVRGVDTDVAGGGIRLHEIASRTRLSEDEVFLALRALASDDLVEVHWMSPRRAVRVIDVSGDARRVVGVWPTPEIALQRMIRALEAIVENTETDEDTRSRARKILEGIAGAGRQLGIGVAAAAIGGQIPGS